MTPARLQSVLFAAFGLPVVSPAPPPASPDRFPTIFTRPAAAPAPARLHPLRLAVGGAITSTVKGTF